MRRLLFALSLLFSSLTFGQTLQQLSPSRSDACTGVQTASGATQQTVTITPAANQFVYICTVEVISVAVVLPVASALTTTTTNLNGMKWFGGLTAAAGIVDKVNFYPAMPLKSATVGAAVTVVSNAAITNVNYNITVTYYLAP